jgi:hypothetical protein
VNLENGSLNCGGKAVGGHDMIMMKTTKYALAPRVLSILLTTAIGLGAQAVPKLHIGNSPSTGVMLTPFSPSEFPVFKDVFDRKSAGLEPASFVVSNETDRAIIGIGVRWTLTDSAGRESSYSNRTHSFLMPSGRPLALPHGRLLAGPETFVSADVLQNPNGGVIGLIPNDQTVARFDNASEIRVVVGSIIFQDGEVVGPDQLGLVDVIRNRREAVVEVIKQVEDALAKGKDPAGVLRQIVSTPIRRSDRVAKLEFNFANELLRARHFDSHLQYLRGIPAPPLFFRKDGGPIWR